MQLRRSDVPPTLFSKASFAHAAEAPDRYMLDKFWVAPRGVRDQKAPMPKLIKIPRALGRRVAEWPQDVDQFRSILINFDQF